uniref:Uncharacterized protein n=1 Tax=Strongyloides papillosus TaxID=174720 RepID=A0A0N5B3U2_STREA
MQHFTGKQLSFDNEMAQKIINQRSKSAPQRRRWFKRVTTTQQPINSFLMDQMITTGLVSAVNIWHDIHSNLIQLDVKKSRIGRGGSIPSDYSDCAQSDTCISYNLDFDDSLSIDSLLCNSIPDVSFSDDSSKNNGEVIILPNRNKISNTSTGNSNILDDNECGNLLSEQIINTEEGEWERQNMLNSPATKEQMKMTTPELSDHWR